MYGCSVENKIIGERKGKVNINIRERYFGLFTYTMGTKYRALKGLRQCENWLKPKPTTNNPNYYRLSQHATQLIIHVGTYIRDVYGQKLA